KVTSPETVGEGEDADASDVSKPCRGRTGRTQCVVDVLAVSPGLHEPGGEFRGKTHGRPEPLDPDSRIGCSCCCQQGIALATPPTQHLGRGAMTVVWADLVDVRLQVWQRVTEP